MSNINPYDLSAVRRAAPSGRKETTRDILYRYLPWRKDRFSLQTETAIIEAMEYLVKLKITQPDDNVPQPSPSTPVETAKPLVTPMSVSSAYMIYSALEEAVAIIRKDHPKCKGDDWCRCKFCNEMNGVDFILEAYVDVKQECQPMAASRSTPTAQASLEPREWILAIHGDAYDEDHGGPIIYDLMAHYALHRLTQSAAPTPAVDTPTAQPEWKRYVRHLGDCGKESSLADSLSGLCWGISSHKWRDCTCGLAQLMMAPTPAGERDYEKLWGTFRQERFPDRQEDWSHHWKQVAVEFAEWLRSHDLGGK